MSEQKKIPVWFGKAVKHLPIDQHTSCRSCGAAVYMCPTGNFYDDGSPKRMPVDVKPNSETGIYKSHFASCPNADRHRSRGGS